MLISEVLEKTLKTDAAENMANRLADKVRNIWLERTDGGYAAWEENFSEDPDGVYFLREENFPNLVAIDYIFKWWGHKDVDGLAGELEVLWKVKGADGMEIYKTWIRFARRDFTLAITAEESRKREINRAEFRKAFAMWEEIYKKQLSC